MAGYRPDSPILHGVSAEVHPGEVVTIIGPNGAGKSTLVKAIAGLVTVSAGSVRLAGSEIANLPAHRLPARGVAYVPQTENVFGSLTVHENLRVGAASVPRRAARPASTPPTRCSRSSASGATRRRTSSPAASARCSPSPAPSFPSPS